MIINWCLIALVALIVGGVCSIIRKNEDYFLVAIILTFFIGVGYFFISLGN